MIRATLAALCLATAAQAQCSGLPLDQLIPPQEQAAIITQTITNHPYTAHAYWRATKGGQQILIAMDQFGQAQQITRLAEALAPAAQAAQRIIMANRSVLDVTYRDAFAEDPNLLFMEQGSLIDLLSPQDWQTLRNIHAGNTASFILARARPEFAIAPAWDHFCPDQATNIELSAELASRLTETGVNIEDDLAPIETLRRLAEVPLDTRITALSARLLVLERSTQATTDIFANVLSQPSLALIALHSRTYDLAAEPLGANATAAIDAIHAAEFQARHDRWQVLYSALIQTCTPTTLYIVHPTDLEPGIGRITFLQNEGWTITPWDITAPLPQASGCSS